VPDVGNIIHIVDWRGNVKPLCHLRYLSLRGRIH
jgi:hypothetical protein